jgi:hypothetical protein
MAYEQVDIFVESSTLNEPVEGVTVRIYDKEGAVLFSEATTDAAGRAGFMLAPQEYTMRFFKFAVSFKQPQHFTVESDPYTPGTTLNQFTVKAGILDKPLAVDPRLCRASGFFRTATGHPRQYLDIHFIAEFRPVILDGTLVMDERRTIKTTKEGYGCIDLIRGACYAVTLEDFEDDNFYIHVPDAPCVNLPDLLFPTISKITLAPVVVNVGQEVTVFPEVLNSAGVPIKGTAMQDLQWTLDGTTVASLSVTSESLLITGKVAGTTTLTATLKNTGVTKIPNTGIEGLPVLVTVG